MGLKNFFTRNKAQTQSGEAPKTNLAAKNLLVAFLGTLALTASAKDVKSQIVNILRDKAKHGEVVDYNAFASNRDGYMLPTSQLESTFNLKKKDRDALAELWTKKKKTDEIGGPNPEKDENSEVEEQPTNPVVTETAEEPDTLKSSLNKVLDKYTHLKLVSRIKETIIPSLNDPRIKIVSLNQIVDKIERRKLNGKSMEGYYDLAADLQPILVANSVSHPFYNSVDYMSYENKLNNIEDLTEEQVTRAIVSASKKINLSNLKKKDTFTINFNYAQELLRSRKSAEITVKDNLTEADKIQYSMVELYRFIKLAQDRSIEDIRTDMTFLTGDVSYDTDATTTNEFVLDQYLEHMQNTQKKFSNDAKLIPDNSVKVAANEL